MGPGRPSAWADQSTTSSQPGRAGGVGAGAGRSGAVRGGAGRRGDRRPGSGVVAGLRKPGCGLRAAGCDQGGGGRRGVGAAPPSRHLLGRQDVRVSGPADAGLAKSRVSPAAAVVEPG